MKGEGWSALGGCGVPCWWAWGLVTCQASQVVWQWQNVLRVQTAPWRKKKRQVPRQEPQRGERRSGGGIGKKKRARSGGFPCGESFPPVGFQAWHKSSVEKTCGIAWGGQLAVERAPWGLVGPQREQELQGVKAGGETDWFGIRAPCGVETGSAGVVGGWTGGTDGGCEGAAAKEGCCWALRALAATFSCFLFLIFSALDSTCVCVSMHVSVAS